MKVLRVVSWIVLVQSWVPIALLFWFFTQLQSIAWLSLLPEGLARWALMIYSNTMSNTMAIRSCRWCWFRSCRGHFSILIQPAS